MNKFAAIILAAGKGKRMKSDLPKVLHRLDGKPLIRHLLETITQVPFEKIVVVVGHKGEMVIDELKDFNAEFVWQKEQNGTGHAVMMAGEIFRDFDGTILVANGDVPFLSLQSIQQLYKTHIENRAAVTCLTADFENPTGYGRIIRKEGTAIMTAIVEEKDADTETKKIREINTGTFCFSSRDLFMALRLVRDNNAQKEYYLTDTIGILGTAGKLCAVWKVADAVEGAGINSAEELLALEASIKAKKL
jgi:UDP-N-acetylglucosamine diphosphorylase/glucosamine-1-phosphate N-acetyltransferase